MKTYTVDYDEEDEEDEESPMPDNELDALNNIAEILSEIRDELKSESRYYDKYGHRHFEPNSTKALLAELLGEQAKQNKRLKKIQLYLDHGLYFDDTDDGYENKATLRVMLETLRERLES